MLYEVITLLLARLDRLPAASRSLLQVAAVIGREFDLETLVAIHPALTSEAIVDLLEELVRMSMLRAFTCIWSRAVFSPDLVSGTRITSYNVCYTKLLRQQAGLNRLLLKPLLDLCKRLCPDIAVAQ